MFSQIKNTIKSKKHKITGGKNLQNSEIFVEQIIRENELRKYGNQKLKVENDWWNIKKEPTQKFMISGLEHHDVNNLKMYSVFAGQLMTHKLAVQEVTFHNLKRVYDLLHKKTRKQHWKY